MTNNAVLPMHCALRHTSIDSSMKTAALKRPLVDPNCRCEAERIPIHTLSAPCTYGVVIGFIVQMITLCVYAFELIRLSNGNTFESERQLDSPILFWFIRILGHIDLCLYSIIWLLFSLTMTKGGHNFLRNRCFRQFHSVTETRRSTFNAGIHFLFGVVVGSFIAWTAVDILLGSPIPLAPIIFTLFADFFLCYFMDICYAWGDCEKI